MKLLMKKLKKLSFQQGSRSIQVNLPDRYGLITRIRIRTLGFTENFNQRIINTGQGRLVFHVINS